MARGILATYFCVKEIFMRIFKDSFRIILRSKSILISMILFYLFIIWAAINPSNTRMLAAKPLGNAMTLSFYLFVALMFITYEYFKKQYNNGVAETIRITSKGVKNYNYKCSFCIINIYALLIYVSITIIVICEFKSFNISTPNNEYYYHIVASTFLNNFLIMELGIIIGIALAKMKNRINAYTIMTFFSLAVSSFPMKMAYMIDSSYFTDSGYDVSPGVIAYKIISWFYIIPRYDLMAMPREETGEILLPYRFFIIGLWMAVFFVVICFTRKHYKKYRVFSVILVILMFVGFKYPTAKMEQRIDPYVNDNGADAEFKYFDATRPKKKEEEANYKITEYVMELSMFVNLSMEVDMKVSESLEEYKMTLYHGYKVSEVTDQNGNKLDFSQDRDNLRIDNKEGYNIERIRMKYYGYSVDAYANYQACYLPAYYAYYPRAGYKRVIDEVSNEAIPDFVDKDTYFKVKVNSPSSYISNLECNNGVFEGKADGFTLVKGFYKKKELVNGNVLIYPYLNDDKGFDGKQTEEEIWESTFADSNEELLSDGRMNSMIFIDWCLGVERHEAYGDKQAFINSGDASYYADMSNIEWE